MVLLPRLKSLQARLLALLLLLVTVVWLGAAGFIWVDASDELGELLDGHLAQSAALLIVQQTGQGIGASDKGGEDTDEVADAPSLHKYAPRVAFQVFHEGQLTMRSANAGTAPMAQKSRGFSTVQLGDRSDWRVFAARGSEGDIQVFVGEQIDSRDSILWAVLKGVLMPLLYALPLLAVVGWLAVRDGLAPLRHLSQVLAQRQPNALEPVVLNDLPSEVEPVVHSLNALFERIQAMVAAERRFTADAAHELRTPIAAIRTQAQVALGAGSDKAQRDHALQTTLAGCDRASHLVEQLLTLSRLESSSNGAPVGRVEVASVAQRVAAELALTALAREQELALDAPAKAFIEADEMLTSVLLRNLLDNALRYSPDGARVDVSVTTDGKQVSLRVEDSGPGLSEAEMARLGERFYRVLGSDKTGSGLGWSIVRRIAVVYQARVAISRSERLGGLCVTVCWAAVPEKA
ncbi:MAG: two-component sensor histidine kinase [Comamonadaceae bacterium CG_4_9_14_3_um_filter_60_33]|nr:MAG: two-component sensor histidine kinase [Comamonadaceae bacterium CG2_30_59_20]PIY27858.1 MAG: two-component sensor histidine kinase [Comamonadaceae bacterium CG_4_10_14_3_um_filter_60_42]PJB40888.1 MAG: two-component sensor histidine kinase [Comamonadaceae bacterium CG_4_9_14_3_um_filter_60_33]